MKKNTFLRMALVSILLSSMAWAQVDVAPFLENSRVFNPVDYGADPTGASDSAPAFNAMVADIGADRHVEIFIPPGQFLLNSRVEFLPSGNTSQYGLSIRGGGQDATEIQTFRQTFRIEFNTCSTRCAVGGQFKSGHRST